MKQSLQREFCGDYSVLIRYVVPILVEPFATVPSQEVCAIVGLSMEANQSSALIVDLLLVDNGVAVGSYRPVGANVE